MIPTEIFPDVFSFSYAFVEGNVGLVLGRDLALAIDAGFAASDGAELIGFARSRGFAHPWLAYTHGHEDHIFGSGAFAGSPVLSHDETPALMHSRILRWARQLGHSVAELSARLAWPTQTFPGHYRLNLGGKTARFLPTPGHSPGHVSVFVEEDGVLFAGDAVVTAIVPTLTDGDGRVLERTLRGLAALEISVLVPGHGPILRGAEKIRDWILWEANYLAVVRQRVRFLRQAGFEAAAIPDMIAFSEWVAPCLLADRHDLLRRHRRMVEKIADEEFADAAG